MNYVIIIAINTLVLVGCVGCIASSPVINNSATSTKSAPAVVDLDTASKSYQEDSSFTGKFDSAIVPVTTLDRVLQLVLEKNQKIQSYTSKSSALKSLAEQANSIPNPEIDLEAENVSGSLDGTDSAEFTSAVSQLIETGGKRSARHGLAQVQTQAFDSETKIGIAAIIAEAKLAYYKVLFAQSNLALAEKEITLSADVVSTVRNKLSYGGILEVELTKAQIGLESSRLRFSQAKQELEGAKRNLAALWAGEVTDLGVISEGFLIPDAPAELQPFDIEQSPLIELTRANINIAEKSYLLEKSLAVPDLTLSAGYRRLQETDDNTIVGSVSIPIALFNRNQEAIASAASNQRAARQEAADYQSRLRANLTTLQEKLTSLLEEKQTLTKKIIPSSKKSLRQTTDAYKLGRVSYLDLLDAHKVFIQSQERANEVLLSALETQIELQKIIGTTLAN